MRQTQTGYTIREVAEMTGLSAHTLRYYERIGLLDGVERKTNGHRLYTEQDIGRLEFLNKLRKTGMPIQGMLRFSRLSLEGDETIPQRRALLEEHQRKVEAEIEALQRNLDVICYKIDLYRNLEAAAQACPSDVQEAAR